MTTAVQRRRGTNTEHASFTGLEGELSVNTTNESVHVHDGSTAGGFELARADASNIVATSIDINGGTIDGTAIGASSASTGAFTTLTATGAFTSRGIDDNADATAITIDSSENVGIGTSAIMEDFGGGRTTLALKGTGTADYSTLQLGNYGTSSNNQIHGLINFYDGTTSVSRIQSIRASNTSDAHLAFYTAPSSGGITQRATLTSDGNLLVGKTSAATNVEGGELRENGQVIAVATNVNPFFGARLGSDGDLAVFRKDTTTVGSIGAYNSANYIQSGSAGSYTGLYFNTNKIEPVGDASGDIRADATVDLGSTANRFKDLYLSGTANVGVSRITGQNLAHSASTLAIGHEGSSKSQLRAYGANSSTTGSLEFMVSNSSGGGSHSMLLNSSGNVGIGTTSPQEMIHAYSGSTSAAIRASGNGNNNSKVEIGYHTTNGPYIKAGSSGVTKLQVYVDNTSLAAEFRSNGDFYSNDGTVHSLSDSRVKKDIADLTDGLDLVKQLRPRTFKFNGKATTLDDDRTRYGFVADEVMAVASQYVSLETQTIDDVEVDDFKSLSTTKMIPMLVKAIQEQQTLIESLTARIAALEE